MALQKNLSIDKDDKINVKHLSSNDTLIHHDWSLITLQYL